MRMQEKYSELYKKIIWQQNQSVGFATACDVKVLQPI